MRVCFIRSFGAVAGASALVLVASGATAEELTVYTAIEAEDLGKYAERFNQAHPDIEIKWVRDSTGIVTAKLLAEKDNPQADVIWGLAATSLMLLKSEGMLEAYAPVGVEKLDPRFVDPADPPYWTGMDAWVAAICFNTVEAEELGLTAPETWQDLLEDQYRGRIAMPNPNSSGTGFLTVSSWIQMMGEDQAWAYMDRVHENVSHYTHSGSKPCKQAAAGEVPLGISFAFRAARLKEQGAPIEVILPEEGVGWDMEATAIVKGTDNLEAAKTLVDWSVTPDANRMYNEGYAVIAIPDLAQPVEHFPTDIDQKMIENDFDWAAANRERILAEWESRYGTKSEPRS